jgi:SPP1 family predicted phage head-tail adaptor
LSTSPNEVTATGWAAHAAGYAEIVPQSGREIVRAGQTVALSQCLLRMRYAAGVTTAMRVRFKGRTLNIVAVVNVEEKSHWMELVCQESR